MAHCLARSAAAFIEIHHVLLIFSLAFQAFRVPGHKTGFTYALGYTPLAHLGFILILHPLPAAHRQLFLF